MSVTTPWGKDPPLRGGCHISIGEVMKKRPETGVVSGASVRPTEPMQRLLDLRRSSGSVFPHRPSRTNFPTTKGPALCKISSPCARPARWPWGRLAWVHSCVRTYLLQSPISRSKFCNGDGDYVSKTPHKSLRVVSHQRILFPCAENLRERHVVEILQGQHKPRIFGDLHRGLSV